MQLTNESPGAPGSATGANEAARESSLTSEYSACPPWAATHFYDRAAGSVEPIRELRRAWA